jgi:hypothetical protein
MKKKKSNDWIWLEYEPPIVVKIKENDGSISELNMTKKMIQTAFSEFITSALINGINKRTKK